MGRSGPRKATLAKGLGATGNTLQEGRHARNMRLIHEHLKTSPEDAQNIWEMIDQDMVKCLRNGGKIPTAEKPLSGSQLKLDKLPMHVVKPVLRQYRFMPTWMRQRTNMKLLLSKDPQVQKKILLAITCESPNTSCATGTTPAEAVAWLVQRANAIGDRLKGLKIADDGIIDWTSICVWTLHFHEDAVLVRHRFVEGQEVIFKSYPSPE